MSLIAGNKRGRRRIFAVNCGACGEEYLNVELEKVTLIASGWELRICNSCMMQDPSKHFIEAITVLSNVSQQKKENTRDWAVLEQEEPDQE